MRYRYITIFVYIILIPFYTTPGWCLDNGSGNEPSSWEFFTDCEGYGIPYSRTLTINTTYLCLLDLACVSIFAYGRWFRRKFDAVYEPHEKIEDAIFALCVIASYIGLVFAIIERN
jgi:hypothetical protein